MNENERKRKKMKENERKMKNWKKKKKMKKKWNMKKKWKNEKMKKNEKWKKMKKWKKWKNEKKNEKNGEKWWKKKEKWKKNGFTRKILYDFVYSCCCNFFSSKSSTISMILFRNVSLSRGKSTTRFGGNRFSKEKWQFSLDVKQKHTFYRRKSTKKNR